MVLALMLGLAATTISGATLLAVHEGAGPFSTFIEKADAPPSSPNSGGVAVNGKVGESPTVELWEEIHEILANLTLLLVILHIGGVVLASYSHKENLVVAMIDGKKRPLP